MDPTPSLPDELWAEVFSYFLPPTFGPYKTWTHIPTVCRRWRNITLNTPRYWSCIVVVDTSIAQLMLQRSKSALLSVAFRHMCPPEPIADEIFQLLHPHIPRIAELEFAGVGDTAFIRRLGLFLMHPFPMLRDVHLHNQGPLMRQPPAQIFLTETMAHIALCGFLPDWSSPALGANIITLQLTPRAPMTVQGATGMFGAISRLTCLEYITLDMAVPDGSPVLPLTLAAELQFSLPSLQAFTLHAHPADLTQIYNRMCVPADARGSFEATGYLIGRPHPGGGGADGPSEAYARDLRSFFSAMRPYTSPSKVNVRGFLLYQNARGTIMFRPLADWQPLTSTPISVPDDDSSGIPPPHYSAGLHAVQFDPLLPIPFALMSVDDVEYLRVDLPKPLGAGIASATWNHFVGRMSNLRVLHLRGHSSADGVVKLLESTLAKDSRLPLPMKIVLEEVNLAGPLYDSLRLYLRARAFALKHLQTLVIRSCTVSRQSIEDFDRYLVDPIAWDYCHFPINPGIRRS